MHVLLGLPSIHVARARRPVHVSVLFSSRITQSALLCGRWPLLAHSYPDGGSLCTVDVVRTMTDGSKQPRVVAVTVVLCCFLAGFPAGTVADTNPDAAMYLTSSGKECHFVGPHANSHSAWRMQCVQQPRGDVVEVSPWRLARWLMFLVLRCRVCSLGIHGLLLFGPLSWSNRSEPGLQLLQG